LRIACNLATEPRQVLLDAAVTEIVLASGDATVSDVTTVTLPAESVAVLRVAG
jgi:hypothetical protein